MKHLKLCILIHVQQCRLYSKLFESLFTELYNHWVIGLYCVIDLCNLLWTLKMSVYRMGWHSVGVSPSVISIWLIIMFTWHVEDILGLRLKSLPHMEHTVSYTSSQLVKNDLWSWLCHAVTVRQSPQLLHVRMVLTSSSLQSPCLILLQSPKYEYFMIL